jgi:hypothetical protein
MKSDAIINIIQNVHLSEDEILKKLKEWVKANPRVGLNGPSQKEQRQNPMLGLRSPLIAAAILGYTRVLKFLIEETKPGADPNREDICKQTALAYAIEAEHIEAAAYLASKTTNYPRDTRFGYTALHCAAGRNQAAVVKEILNQCPQIIDVTSNEKLSALHLATEYNAFECIQLLVNAKANLSLKTHQDATAYEMSLVKANGSIISYFLDFPQASSAIEVKICGIKHSPLKIVMDNSTGTIPALITLLEAGAGLDLNRIPDKAYNVLKIIGQVRNSDWELLVVADHKISPQQNKKVFITTLAELLERLDDPSYHFRLKQLLHSARHPALKSLPHIESITTKINSLAIFQPSFSASSNSASSSSHNSISLESIKKLGKQELVIRVGLLKEEFKSLSFKLNSQLMSIFSQLIRDPIQNQLELDIDEILTVYLKQLDNLLTFSHHKKIPHSDIFAETEHTFRQVFTAILMFVSRPEFKQLTLNITIPLETNLRELIHGHAKPLRQKFPNFYNTLLDALANTLFKSAQHYIQSKDFDLAYTISREVMYFNSKLVINNPELKRSVDSLNSQCLTALSKINIHENRFTLSIINLEQALTLKPINLALHSHYSETVALLFENHPNIPKERAFNLLKNSINYLSTLVDPNDGSIHSQVICEERSYIPKFEELLAKLEVEIKESTLVKELSGVTKRLESISLRGEKLPHYAPVPLFSPYYEASPSSSICASSSSSSSSASSSWTPISQKTKTKTRGESKPELDTKHKSFSDMPAIIEKHETAKFSIPEGYIKPVKISGTKHLFMTLPENDARFSKFYKLIEGQNAKLIAEKGVNQQGIKLSHVEVQSEVHAPRKQVTIARLKLCGGETLRAWGYIEQTSKDKSGAVQKLVVFRPEGLTTKQEENRTRYKPKGYSGI